MSPERALNSTADALHAVATTTRTTVRQGSEAANHAAEVVAKGLDATADYVRAPLAPARRFLATYPSACLGGAIAIGFAAGTYLLWNCGRSSDKKEACQ